MSRLLPSLFALLLLPPALPAAEVRLARHPDYHSGKVVFSYLGDLWLVNDDGSGPRRLTVHTARDIHPRFSPDGKWIAFSSARYGNYDVFVVPSEGGEARRMTYHNASDTVVGWTRDSKKVVFQSTRGQMYPTIPNLFEVPATGGLEEAVPTDWGFWGSYAPDGKKFAFNRHPAAWSRKHYRGSYAADLWVMDVDARQFKKIVDADLPDEQKPNNFWPMYGNNGEIFFVSDRGVMAKAGSSEVLASVNNIWKVNDYGGSPVQVTFHKSGSLFWPSISADGKTIVYEEGFGLWKLDIATGKTSEIKVNINSDAKDNRLDTVTVNGEADSYHLSPSGKRAVISTRGELFTIATDKGDITRLMQTPNVREVQPQWSPDGKWIAFVCDRSGRDEVWLSDEFGKNAKKVSDSDSQKNQLAWSPNGKGLLFTGSDKKLYKHDVDSGNTTVVASGEVIGFGGGAISNPEWSPDGKWISYTKAGDTLLPHIYVIPSTGGKEQRITDLDTYSDSSAIWTPDGKNIVYLSGLDISNIGQRGSSTAQLFVISLLPEEKDPADKGIDNEAEAQVAERERPRGGRGGRPGDEEDATRPAMERKVDVKIDFNRIGRRARQLTRVADTITSVEVTPDSRNVLFVTSGTEGGRSVQSIWSIQLDGERLTRLTQSSRSGDEEEGPSRFGGLQSGFSSLQITRDGRTLFYRQGGGIHALPVSFGLVGGAGRGGEGSVEAPSSAPPSSPSATPGGARGASATARRVNFTARIEVDTSAERKQVFNESWRVMKHRFYDPAMHGVEWNRMKATYEPLLEHAADQEELHNIVNMMIGELNASHTGMSGGGRRGRAESGDVQTRHPGFELTADTSGYYKITHIYKNGPADRDYVKVNVGDFVLAIDDQDVKAGDNYWKHYSTAPGGKLEFTVSSKPSKEGSWKTKVTPISSTRIGDLQYEKWVNDRRAQVDKLTTGEIGYLHIRQMNEGSLRKFERDLAELHTKKALIIDQRFNPGGNIDQELLQILQQKQYQYTKVRDSINVTRPLRAFFGPMVVMANERSTSDAEVFPDGFRTLKLGKVVGVTTYGAVIGTGAHQLMDGSSMRTPGSGLWNVNGTNLENYGVPPDVYVDNTPDDFLRGRDAQLERSIDILREEMRRRK